MAEEAEQSGGGAGVGSDGGGAGGGGGSPKRRVVNPPARAPLPDVVTKLSPVGAVARLEKASRRGKLPGFHRGSEDSCSVTAFGDPFDKVVRVSGTKEADGQTRLSFRMGLPWKAPTLLAIACIIMIWPGEPATDSLLKSYWGWYSGLTNPKVADTWFRTWMWYYPIAVPSSIWFWWMVMQRTDKSTAKSARETIEKIAEATAGEVTAPRLRR